MSHRDDNVGGAQKFMSAVSRRDHPFLVHHAAAAELTFRTELGVKNPLIFVLFFVIKSL